MKNSTTPIQIQVRYTFLVYTYLNDSTAIMFLPYKLLFWNAFKMHFKWVMWNVDSKVYILIIRTIFTTVHNRQYCLNTDNLFFWKDFDEWKLTFHQKKFQKWKKNFNFLSTLKHFITWKVNLCYVAFKNNLHGFYRRKLFID